MSFTLDVKAFCEKAKKNPETVMRAVSLKLFSAIIKSSPVDTGRFRGNWQTTGATPATGLIAGVDPTGNKAVNNASTYIGSTPNWYEFTLTNNLPYAERLEYGWSKQAPVGMVRVNIARFNTLLNEEAAKVR
ncbi:HK97 gp10 family phage protein [Salmonella enterica subsp. enterica]|nr:HK97 gp10 family phage protein [Salmonella enterica subsp. enterica]EJM7831426.1 HK97 gp10 family phage protein [Salmonella enterica]EJT0199958.1 HK97 gp10 family phage protein [Salmonella enterica]